MLVQAHVLRRKEREDLILESKPRTSSSTRTARPGEGGANLEIWQRHKNWTQILTEDK